MVAELFVKNKTEDKMKNKTAIILSLIIFYSTILSAQVPVREEPRHHPVLQNKYIRLLDVWIPPGDTTQFHIHSTPSLFVILSKTITTWQEKGKQWIKDSSVLGRSWYRSFTPDSLIHRVCNAGTTVFHVNDIEILSSYSHGTIAKTPLPFTVEFENEKAIAYRITTLNSRSQIISGRGPMIAELVTGTGIKFHDNTNNQTKEIETGKYLYIEPGTAFYFSATENSNTQMVLFEIK
jgi:quercetin dioxygenase-like cupin family protein